MLNQSRPRQERINSRGNPLGRLVMGVACPVLATLVFNLFPFTRLIVRVARFFVR